jgi:hypothetical protein
MTESAVAIELSIVDGDAATKPKRRRRRRTRGPADSAA